MPRRTKFTSSSIDEPCLSFLVPGLPDHTDLGGSAEVASSYSHVDADGCYSSFHGWSEPNGSVDDAAEHDAKRKHDEHYVDERHGDGSVSGHGFHGDVYVTWQLSQRPGIRRLSLIVTLGPEQPGQEKPRENLKKQKIRNL